MASVEQFVVSRLERLIGRVKMPQHPFRLILPLLGLFLVFTLLGPLNCLWFVLIAAEIYVLYRGQREIFGWGWHLLPRPVLWMLVWPGVVAHELSHVLACLSMGIRPTRINWFRPEQDEFGHMMLGSVAHVETGIKRQTLIATAPLWLLPLILLGFSGLMLGWGVLSDPLTALTTAPIWAIPIWAWVCLSAGQAAFPSVDDPIPTEGGFLLGVLAVLAIWITGTASLVVLILLLPALAAGLLWGGLRLLMHRRGLKPVASEVSGLPGRSSYVCDNCLHIQDTDDKCDLCGHQIFYKTTSAGYVSEFPPELNIPCQSCDKKGRRLFLRSYRGIYGESGERRVIRKIGGYWCDECVHKRFWQAERKIALKIWSAPAEAWVKHPSAAFIATLWLTLGPGAILRKTLNMLLNIPGELAPPFNMAAAGAVHADQIIERKQAKQQQAADGAETAEPTITPPPGWWVVLSPGDQKLILAGIDYYKTLGVSSDAPVSAIKKAYRRSAQAAHPDHGGSNEAMKEVVTAWDILQDEALRYAYDHRAEIPAEYRQAATA